MSILTGGPRCLAVLPGPPGTSSLRREEVELKMDGWERQAVGVLLTQVKTASGQRPE